MSILSSDFPAKAAGLGAALFAASHVPILLLDDALVVVLASHSFRQAFHLDAVDIVGRPFCQLGSGEWNADRLRLRLVQILEGGTAVEGLEFDLIPKGRPNRRLRLDAQLLELEGEGRQLLVTIEDLTEGRARERQDQVRLDEKDVMLQELQHRMANSLQIIASILMQGAKRVRSAKARGHLHDAHHRILSVAAVQSHLAKSHAGEVQLRAYFTDLCRSIGASMIDDSSQIVLEVLVDDSTTDPDTSMSLGMIVTELVINALKHAFPDQRKGKILVEYRRTGDGWMLSVTDDGVGLPVRRVRMAPGLGTSIVDALARKLRCQVRTAIGSPGTSVSIGR
ncbi:sensor histidine kinase [Rhizorhabdus argentea]|uniref:sensor histidine kinase n=1 Tax=Rhizorhabdus argentea TaxID=1387174 RepID=UPI0030EDAA3D